MEGAHRTFRPTARQIAGACGWAVVALGVLVLIGWAVDSSALTRIAPGMPSMKPLTAVAMILIGAALVLLAPAESPGARHRLGVGLGAAATLIAAAVLAEYLFGDLGIDDLLFGDSQADAGRPSSVTAVAVGLCGLALVTLDRDPPRHRAAAVLVPLLGFVVLATLVGYAYDVDYLRGTSSTPGMALPSAIALGLTAIAIALSRPKRGIVAFLGGDDPASTLARRLAPLAVLLPLFLGALRIAAEDLGLLGEHVGLALTTLASIIVLLAVIVVSTRDVRVQSGRRDLSERSFRAVTENSIEAIVSGDEAGLITYVNPAAERMFGYSATEMLGREIKMLMPDRYRGAHEHGMRRFLETGERRVIGETVELVGLRRDGGEFPLSLSLVDWRVEGRTYFTGTIRDISKRVVADRARRELAAIVDGTADAVIGWGLDGIVTSWNRGAERIYGYDADEMVGRPLDALVPPGHESELPELLERVRAGERIENLETIRMRKDWRRIDIALTVSPIRDEQGVVTGVSTIARDISEQKAAERKLAESARHFELINDLVATCGFDGYFKKLNGAWEQTFGWTPEQLLPNPFMVIVHPDDREAVESEVAKLARGGTTAEFKIRVETSAGGWLWTEWSASPDVPAGLFYCVGREVSGRMEAERALTAERRQFADAQQIASVGSWELDLDSGERTWSAQQYRNHGFEPGDPLPTLEQVLERIHPEDRAGARDRIDQIFNGTERELRFSYRVVLGDGRVREIEVEGRPLVDADGSRRLLGTSRDVTAERDAERLKDDFFGLVSHELRTPLTSIIGYSELLAEVESENLSEQGRRFIEVIERNSRRELSLVGDLLLLTKITAGTFEIEVGRADLTELAASTLEAARPVAEQAGVELSLDAGGPQVVDGDPHRLAQVVENLVSNAIKFTPRGGRVEVKVERTARTVGLEVTDTGIGIAEDDLGHLFDRMYRADEAERRRIQGTGLGLTIVKAIVDAHEATIAVESEPGKGTRFRVELSARPSPDERGHGAPARDRPARSARVGDRRMTADND